MSRLTSHTAIRTVLALLLLLLTAGSGLAQIEISTQVSIIGQPIISGDDITLNMVVRESGGLAVADLTSANFSVTELFENLQLSSEAALPVALAVIVDLSARSDVDLIQDTLRAYFSTYYRQDDTVIFFILGQGTETDGLAVVQPANLGEINALIDGLVASNRIYTITEALQASLERLRAIEDRTILRHALFVSSALNNIREADASGIFTTDRIPFHVVQAHRDRRPSTTYLRTLASTGGGLFASNQDGRSVLKGDTIVAVGTLKVMYDTIANSRVMYTLSYHSANQSLESLRRVNVIVTLNEDVQVTTSFSYERAFQPPQVEMVTTSTNPLRRPFFIGDTVSFDLSEIPLVVRVGFPDGVQRQVESLRLEVVEAATGNVLQSKLELAPARDSTGNYTILWSLQPFTTPNSNTPVQLVVTSTDELGLSASVASEGSVSVGALPIPVTVTVPPTFTPAIPATPTGVSEQPTAAATAQQGPFSVLGAGSSQLVSILALVIAGLIVVVVLLMLSLRRAQHRQALAQEAALPMEEFAPAGLEPMPRTERSGAQPQAVIPATNGEGETHVFGRLVVVTGLNVREIVISSEEFVIGRRLESGCDFAIDQPFISPRHCMFIHRGGNFTIRDLGAKNGTFVNGERIPRERDIIVPIGSEVGITKYITVELWDPKTVVDLASRTKQTSDHQSQVEGDELVFRPMLGIRYIRDDDEEVPDDYSPI